MRVVIVDDESIARRQLKMHLSSHHEVDIVGEASSGLEGVDRINKLKPDLAFLDIEMPDISGLDIVPYLEKKPIIIFSSSHDHYAIKAFDLAALDYVLKPVEPERLKLALERVHQSMNREVQTQLPSPKKSLTNLIAKSGSQCTILKLRDVMQFQKEGRYTQVLLENGEHHLIELALDQLETEINGEHFFRINRQVMIRRTWVVSMRPGNAASGMIETSSGHEFSVSRGRWKPFKNWFMGQA